MAAASDVLLVDPPLPAAGDAVGDAVGDAAGDAAGDAGSEGDQALLTVCGTISRVFGGTSLQRPASVWMSP